MAWLSRFCFFVVIANFSEAMLLLFKTMKLFHW